MKGNSSRKNAFAYFVEEYIAEQSELGRNISKRTAVEECTAGWSALEPEKRLKYCNMANPMLNRVNKCKKKKTPTPPNMEWLDPVTGEYGEKWFRYVRAGDELYYLKNSLTSERRLKRFNFYFVHFNYFCQPSLKEYVPAELALLEFNLSEGIKNVYHTLINPGSIPLGYAHEAKRNSQNIHGIPIPPMAKGEKDMGKIIESVKNFLAQGADSKGKFPPLFTLEENVLPAMHMLNDMVKYDEDEPEFIVYPIHRMFYWTKYKCIEYSGKGAGFLDESFALKEIERDCFRYIVDIACDFHKECESRFMMCSKSIVKRLAYTICDHCCRDLDITLVAGKHVHKIPREGSSAKKNEEKRRAKRGSTEERQQERVDKTEEEVPLETALARQCKCGEATDLVGDRGTKKVPTDDLAKLNAEEIQLFYSAFLHNLMEGKVKFDLEEEMKQKDYLYLKSLSDDDACYNPCSLRRAGSDGSALPTAAEELQAYRRYQKRRMRNLVHARIKEREARESREAFERKLAEEAKGKGKEMKLVDEVDK